jgi:4-aminobutyrate aminotransferase
MNTPTHPDRPTVSAESVLKDDAEFIGSAAKVRFSPFAPVKGRGWFLWSADGTRYIDFSASSGVAALGYGNQRVAAAVSEEVASLNISSLCTTPHHQSARLAARLCALAPGEHAKKAIFAATGSEASDYACNLARASSKRKIILAFEGSYHGATSGSAGVSGHPALAYAKDAGTVLFPYPTGNDGPRVDAVLQSVQQYLSAHGSEVAAVLVEALQSDGGIRVPAEGFLLGLQDLCSPFGIILMVDEVKTGMGRTGTIFASETAGITPDVLILGKALGGGYPLAAVVGRAQIMDAPILCASTLGGSNVLCAAGNAALDDYEDPELLLNVRLRGEQLVQELRAIESSVISDIRGKGLMVGVELAGSAGMPTGEKLASAVSFRAWQLGLFLVCSGNENNVLEITPPLIIDKAAITEGVRIIATALQDVLSNDFDIAQIEAYSGWGNTPVLQTN